MGSAQSLSDLSLTDRQKAILAFCAQPRSLREIRAKFLIGYNAAWIALDDLVAFGYLLKTRSISSGLVYKLDERKVKL